MRHDGRGDARDSGCEVRLSGAWSPPLRRAFRWLPALLVVLILPLAIDGVSVNVRAVGAQAGGAQAGDPPVGSRLRVANTDGQSLNLRAGAGPSEPIVARLPEGTELNQSHGETRRAAGVSLTDPGVP